MLSNKSNIVATLTDIRFWVLLTFVLRLYGIWFPPLEVEHNWRQTTVTMVARNFFEIDANIFYPRVDMAGNLTGITGMEFPLLNYIIFLFSKVFGYDHWYGRLINLVISSFGVWYFYKLINLKFDKEKAFYASFLLLFSLWFAYSRKIMPDTFAASLAIISLYGGFRYFDSKRWQDLLVYFAFGLLSLLAKIPVMFLFVYMVFPMFKGKLIQTYKVVFVGVSMLLLSPVLYWYFIWAPYLTEHFGFWHFFMGKDMLVGLKELLDAPLDVLTRLFFTPLRISGLVLLLGSLGYLTYIKEWKPVLIYFVGLISFVVLVAIKAGWTFHHHNYYIMVLVPVFVVPIMYVLPKLNKYVLIFVLAFTMIEGVTSQMHEFRIKEDHAAMLDLEKDLNSLFPHGDLVAFNSGNYPTPMYFAHRKGWTLFNENLESPTEVAVIKNKGCKAIVVLKRVFGTDVELDYPVLLENRNYRIYSLK